MSEEDRRISLVLEWIRTELEKHGFETRTNVAVEGRSVKHVLDIVAEMSPLPNSRLVLGVVIARNRLGVEDIEKFSAWLNELPIDKLIVVPTQGIDGSAISLASEVGIDVVAVPEDILQRIEKGVSISEELAVHVEPLIKVENIVDEVRKKVYGGLLRKHHAHLDRLVLCFVPTYIVRVELPKRGLLSEATEVVEGYVVVDALMGYPVVRKGKGFDIDKEIGSLLDVSPEALNVLRIVSEEGSVEIGAIASRLGMDRGSVKVQLEDLMNRSLVDLYGDLVELRSLDLDKFLNIDEMLEKTGAKLSKGLPKPSRGIVVLEPRKHVSRLRDLIEALSGKVLDEKVLFLPIYVALIVERRNGVVHEKTYAFSAIDGSELEGYTAILAEPDIVEAIKRVESLIPPETVETKNSNRKNHR